MTRKLLTIIVPTYKRAKHLSLLLKTLSEELVGLQNEVSVVVGDNASPDETPNVTSKFSESYSSAHILRHSENVGADENFSRCIETVSSRFFWIIGDDDLPKSGVLAKVMALLKTEDPDLLYLGSEWLSEFQGPNDGTPVPIVKPVALSRDSFAHTTHIWVTFISGMIINFDRLKETHKDLDIRRFSGMCLVQLGWVLPMLDKGSRFLYVPEPCILATKDNTGGYQLLTVFGINFPRIVRAVFGNKDQAGAMLVGGTVAHYLPGLVWQSRLSKKVSFQTESPWKDLRKELGNHPLFWVLLLP